MSGEFPHKVDGQPVLYHKSNEKVGGMSEEEEAHRLFCVNGPVAVLPIIDWINWDLRQEDKGLRKADARIFRFQSLVLNSMIRISCHGMIHKNIIIRQIKKKI